MKKIKKYDGIYLDNASLGQFITTVFEPDSISYEELFNLKSFNKELDDEVKKYLLTISSKKPQVLGTTPAIFASLQVNETIKYIIGREEIILAPKILLWDIFDISSFKIVDF